MKHNIHHFPFLYLWIYVYRSFSVKVVLLFILVEKELSSKKLNVMPVFYGS